MATRTKTNTKPKKARLLDAATGALKALKDAAGDERDVEMISEVALAMVFALAQRAGIGECNPPTAEAIERARNVLFGGRPTRSDALRIREIAEALGPFVQGARPVVTFPLSVESEKKVRSYARKRGIGMNEAATELARIATDRLSFDIVESPSIMKLQRQLRLVDLALVAVDLAPFVERLRKGAALSGVITDLLMMTLALGTTKSETRADVHKRVERALASTKPKPAKTDTE